MVRICQVSFFNQILILFLTISNFTEDIATLRFFFNMGIDSFESTQTVGHIASQFSNLVPENAAPSPATPQPDINRLVKSMEKMSTDDNNNTPTTGSAAPLVKSHSNVSNYSNSSQYHGIDYQNRRGFKRRAFHSGNGRGYHNQGNYQGNNRNGGYQNNRGGNHHGSEYVRNNQENSYRGSTTPTSVVSHQSSTHDSGVVVQTEIQTGTADYSQQATVDYSTLAQQQQYPQYAAAYPQEYDQNNYCVQPPIYCTYTF